MHQRDSPTKPPLLWSEAARAVLCMAPMLVAFALGNSKYLVPLGQGGFFYSALFLPARERGRLLMGSILMALGLGFYLMGGNVVQTAWVAIVFTFFVAVNLSFLSGWQVEDWKVGGTLALTFIVIYTAGLNSGSPETTSANFLAFSGVLAWSVAVSLLPIWRPIPPPVADGSMGVGDITEQGVRMGIGTSVALFISYLFGFYKFGWAPSAVGNIVRYNEKTTHMRAWARFLGTVAGAALAVVALGVTGNLTVLIYASVFFAAMNGLFKARRIGQIPFFYTATIILLYSSFDISSGPRIAAQRVIYNLIGIAIGLLVVLYPFPALMRRVRGNLPAG